MPNNENKIRLVLAEDDKFISLAYKDGLAREGIEVFHAADGLEAVKLITKEKPDLVLLDLIMPEKNGFEVLEEIKRDKMLAKIPIIVLSNLGQDSDIQKARELGATDYLIKSNFSMAEVIEKIKDILKK